MLLLGVFAQSIPDMPRFAHVQQMFKKESCCSLHLGCVLPTYDILCRTQPLHTMNAFLRLWEMTACYREMIARNLASLQRFKKWNDGFFKLLHMIHQKSKRIFSSSRETGIIWKIVSLNLFAVGCQVKGWGLTSFSLLRRPTLIIWPCLEHPLLSIVWYRACNEK